VCGDGGEGRVHSWIYDGICRWKEELSLVSRLMNEVFAHRNLEKCWVLEDVRTRLMNPRLKEEVRWAELHYRLEEVCNYPRNREQVVTTVTP
jgi:hypothetical protein